MARTPLLSVVVLAFLGLPCGHGADPPPPPEEVLDVSIERLVAVDSLRVRFQLDASGFGFSQGIAGEEAYQAGELAFGSYTLTEDSFDDEREVEVLYFPPDLYTRLDGAQWYVLSPWSQGMGPDELDDFSAGGSPTEFLEEMQEDLKDIERLPDEHVADETHLRYRASAEPDETPDMTAEVLLWLRREDLLPHKVEVYLDGEGFTLDAAYEFLEYGEQAVAPARPTDALPWRDHELPDAPCTGDAFEACLAPASGLDAIAQASCGGEGRRVCLAPLGNVSAELVRHLAQHYQDVYGLSVAVLAPSAVPAEAADNLRQQVDAPALIDYMAALFPDAYADPQAVLIGITPLDLYNSTSHYRYVFGVKRTAADPKAVVSTFRMDPETYSEPPDRELLFARVRKLVTKYIGLLYYDLPASDDPASPMFDSILGPSDLDAMEEPLPVATQR